jgi:ABC-type transport system involved in Fe-S cluster assembly fused permease/ATPase subunit
MNRNYKKLGLKIGLSIGVLMSLMFLFSFSDSFSGLISENKIFFLIILAPFLILYSLFMLVMSNSSCGLKASTDCSSEITIAIIFSLIIFSLVGYFIGFVLEKIRNNK